MPSLAETPGMVRPVVHCLLFLDRAIGLIPVNNDFQPTADGIEIWLVSNPIHTDIVLPIHAEAMDWREHFPEGFFSVDARRATHVAIGWGSKGFYINTPTWADLRFSTVVKALFWPSASCMHATLCTAEGIPQDARSVKISAAQYQRLVEFVNSGFRRQCGRLNDSLFPMWPMARTTPSSRPRAVIIASTPATVGRAAPCKPAAFAPAGILPCREPCFCICPSDKAGECEMRN